MTEKRPMWTYCFLYGTVYGELWNMEWYAIIGDLIMELIVKWLNLKREKEKEKLLRVCK